MTLLLEEQYKLVMIGDSITDADRARPIGTRNTGLGYGYVAQVDNLLTASRPELEITVVNTGISGNTVRDLASRWQTDVLDLAPDWVSIMIGTNDVWRQFDEYDSASAVMPEEFVATLTRLITMTRPLVKGISLLTPFYIQPDLSDPMRTRMDEYCALVTAISEDTDVHFGSTQIAFDAVMRVVPPLTIAEDRVHPTPLGHTILAKTFLETIEFRW